MAHTCHPYRQVEPALQLLRRRGHFYDSLRRPKLNHLLPMAQTVWGGGGDRSTRTTLTTALGRNAANDLA
ncbi:MAG: hypothetical protein MI923_04815 [Phycisphaerales bacterium]|nr:hypothetical protein [Phycisphaerales bacterium]